MTVRDQRQLDGLHERRQLHRHRLPPVLRFLDLRLAQVLPDRVARQARGPHDLSHRFLLAAVHPQDFANHGHGDHSSNPAARKRSRVGETPGSNFSRHKPHKWVKFRSAPTMLIINIPQIVLGTLLLWWLDGQARPKWSLLPKPSVRVSFMACASLLVLGWNWLYLFAFWRA